MTALQNKMREQLAKNFLEALNQDQLPWKACWQSRLPENATTNKRYRGINALMLSFAAAREGFRDHRWCTFHQAAEKGWHIQKGAKGWPVEYWAYYDREKRKLLSWTEARKVIKEQPDYAEENLQLRSRVYNVFNGAQIEGIPELDHSREMNPEGITAQRDTLLKNMDLKLEEGGSQPYYVPETDTVCLPYQRDFFDDYAYACTLLHECGHATGHETRLNRDLTAAFGTTDYAKEELRAEISSAFTCQALGLQLTDEQLSSHMTLHKAYIQSWASSLKNAPEELFKAIKDAEKISDYLIEKGEFQIEREISKEAAPELDYVGRIDYLSSNGKVMESIEYRTAEELIQAARDECYAGAPICLSLYEDKDGNHISTNFIRDLDPPPKGLTYEKGADAALRREKPVSALTLPERMARAEQKAKQYAKAPRQNNFRER